jgi:DNA-binding GntR family transcriptional regulator
VNEATEPKRSGLPSLKKRIVVSDLDHVFGELKQSMMMGKFAPGQPLKLRELAEVFGTSYMPVREALHRLAMVEALETAPRRSPSVPQAGRKRLRDILSLRIDLECKAAILALENDEGTLAKALRSITAKMDAEAGKNKPNIHNYLELNQRFHFEIYRRSNNDVLLNLIELLWMRYGPLLNLLITDDDLSYKHRQHVQIADAIEMKSAAKLMKALSEDLTAAASAIERKIPDTSAD